MSSKQLEKRESIVQELLSTEKNFVAKLGLIVTHFLKPLSDNADSLTPFISRANLRAIFSELTVVHGLNTVLFRELDAAVNNAKPVSDAAVGKVFLKMGSFLRWYHSYVSNYDNAFQTLKKLKSKSAAFRGFISATEAKPELNFTDLESLLILPIQRIPQYNLLFTDLVKCTPAAHVDYADTNAALQLMNQIGSYINEKKREAENIYEVIGIGKTLVGFPNLAVPYRRFVRKSFMFHLPDNSPSTAVVLFAFNDVLLVSQETEPNQYTVVQYAYWDRVQLTSPDASASSPSPPDNPLSIQLRLKDIPYFFVAKDPDERKEWFSLIRDHCDKTKRKSTEREVQLALKKKLLATFSNAAPQGSLAIRSLGVLAKGMMLGLDDSNSLDSSVGNSGSESASTSTTASGSGNPGSGNNSGSASTPGAGFSSNNARALEERARSKKTRELVEQEVKQQLLKEGIKDGSIDEFLAQHSLEAFYVVPLFLSAKANAAALLALTPSTFSIFVKSKLQYSGFLYDIKEIASKDHPVFTLKMNDGNSFECRSQFCDDIIYQLRRSYLLTYFGIPEHMTWAIATDDWRKPEIFLDTSKIVRGGFARTYRAACTYLNLPFREDIVWDVLHNPTNNLPKTEEDPYSANELDLTRLEDLTNTDFKALMFALRFNPFFTSLVIRDITVSRDAFSQIAELFRHNYAIRRLVLKNNSLSKEHIAMLVDPFNATPTATMRKMEVIDIRDSNIDNAQFVAKYLETHKKSVHLTTLDLSNTSLSAKGVTALLTNMRKSTNLYHSLEALSLSGSKMDTEASAAAAAFLATPCAIKRLDLSNTQIKLLQVIEAATRGCIYLTTLDISHNKITKKMEGVLVKFVTKLDSLVSLKMNGTNIPAETFARVVEATSSNVYLTHLKLFADENDMGPLGATFIARSFKDMKGISELSLADNDFGDEGLAAIFQTFTSEGTGDLKRLVLDGNFKLKTAKSRTSMLRTLAKMVCHKNCKLVHLSIAGNKATSESSAWSRSSTRAPTQLRADLIQFLECLPQLQVSELNISGHRMGPKGVLALGRALQEAKHLKKLWWDENGTTLDSFNAMVHAVKSNTSLIQFGPPLLDLSSLLSQGDTFANTKILMLVETLAMHISANNIRAMNSAIASLASPVAILSPKGPSTSETSPPVTDPSAPRESAISPALSARKSRGSNDSKAVDSKSTKKDAKDASATSASTKVTRRELKGHKADKLTSMGVSSDAVMTKSAKHKVNKAAPPDAATKAPSAKGLSLSQGPYAQGVFASSKPLKRSMDRPLSPRTPAQPEEPTEPLSARDTTSGAQSASSPESAPDSVLAPTIESPPTSLRHLRQPSQTALPRKTGSKPTLATSSSKITAITGISQPTSPVHSPKSPRVKRKSARNTPREGAGPEQPTETTEAPPKSSADEKDALAVVPPVQDEIDHHEEVSVASDADSVLELDEPYDEDADSDYQEEPNASDDDSLLSDPSDMQQDTRETDDEDNDQGQGHPSTAATTDPSDLHEDEEANEKSAFIRRSHYRSDSDNEDEPMSPRSPHVSLHIEPSASSEDLSSQEEKPAETPVRVPSVDMKPMQASPSLAALQDAALTLPSDLKLGDFVLMSPLAGSRGKSIMPSPRPQSDSPPPLSARAAHNASIALEHGEVSSDEESSENDSEPRDEPMPTLPADRSPVHMGSGALSPRITLTAPSSAAKSSEPAPQEPTEDIIVISPRSPKTLDLTSSGADSLNASHSSYLSTTSVGMFEHAPMMPMEAPIESPKAAYSPTPSSPTEPAAPSSPTSQRSSESRSLPRTESILAASPGEIPPTLPEDPIMLSPRSEASEHSEASPRADGADAEPHPEPSLPTSDATAKRTQSPSRHNTKRGGGKKRRK